MGFATGNRLRRQAQDQSAGLVGAAVQFNPAVLVEGFRVEGQVKCQRITIATQLDAADQRLWPAARVDCQQCQFHIGCVRHIEQAAAQFALVGR